MIINHDKDHRDYHQSVSLENYCASYARHYKALIRIVHMIMVIVIIDLDMIMKDLDNDDHDDYQLRDIWGILRLICPAALCTAD